MLNSVIADTLSRIRNGYMAKKNTIELIHSKFIESVVKVLYQEGYVGTYTIVEKPTTKKKSTFKVIQLSLSYHNNHSAIKTINMISKPGCKRYMGADKLLKFYNQFGHSGLGTVILSTNKGVIAGHTALENNLGGELLCVIF
jgi:small subunit ribosomal protein S8